MTIRAVLRPANVAELADAIGGATRDGTHLEIRGGGSKSEVGAPRNRATLLQMGAFAGVIDYDPAELVLTVGAGTLLSDVAALVADARQMLAFEPFDHGPVFGHSLGAATIGGIVASGVAGSRRLSMGSVRDHLLGFEGVSGRGEHFIAGGRVVKNVTGYDLSKLICGSWGRLVALTQVTLKVLPSPRTRATRFIEGLSAREAQSAMARAMGSQAELSAAAHVPEHIRGRAAWTAFRVEGFGQSVMARCKMLEQTLASFGAVQAPAEADGEAIWSDLRSLDALADGRPLWRVNVPPSGGPRVIESLELFRPRWLFDWAGGLIWLSCDADHIIVRAAAQSGGGHALLLRAPEKMRVSVPALHPPAAGVAALEARIRRAFDPHGVFETGRFLDNINAD